MTTPDDFARARAKRTKHLPDDWTKTLRQLENGSCYVNDLKIVFDVSHSTLSRWRNENADFDEACFLKLKFKNHVRTKEEKPEQEIDVEKTFVDLRMLELSTKNLEDRRVLGDALAVIEALRREVRAARSETQRVRERAHFRTTNGASRSHASRGVVDSRGFPD